MKTRTVAAIIAASVIFVGALENPAHSIEVEPCSAVTTDTYAKLREGMPLAEVKALIPCKPFVDLDSGNARTLVWFAPGHKASINITFLDGVITSRGNSGLNSW